MKLTKLQLILFVCFLGPLALAAQCSSKTFSPTTASFKVWSKGDFLPPAKINSVLLPKWSADNLPFFCRIEHEWAKSVKKSIPLKFRLGSVEYVDWLEGKSWNLNQY